VTDDNEHQEHGQPTRESVALVTFGTILWVVTVAVIVARGWGA
jgi:hypothetical protein